MQARADGAREQHEWFDRQRQQIDLLAPRLRMADRGIVVTDGCNVIYDMASGAIAEPAALAAALKAVTGVVDHGLFLDLADEALVGTDDGVVKLLP